MKELRGSDKQIKWARDINFQFMVSIENLKSVYLKGNRNLKTEKYKNWLSRRYDREEETKLLEEIERLDKIEESKFWIENRYVLNRLVKLIESGLYFERDNMAFVRGIVIKVLNEILDLDY